MVRHKMFVDWKIRFIKMCILSKLIYRLNEISFHRHSQLILKFIWKGGKALV